MDCDVDVVNNERRLAFHTYNGIKSIKGVEVIDFDLRKPDKLAAAEVTRLLERVQEDQNHPSQYPLLSVNQVKWNPNHSSYLWIFSGSQTGLCRVSFVCHPMLLKNKKICLT